MDYEKKYKEVLGRAKGVIEQNPLMEYLKKGIEYIFPELKKSEDERIREELKEVLDICLNARPQIIKELQYLKFINWLKKQGKQPEKVSIWKHWKDGICGNGEGKLIYLIKNGNNYSLSSSLGFECDYIELSELDSLMLEKQGEQKPADKVESDKKFTPIESALKDLICDVDNSYTIEQVRRFLFEYGYKDKILNAAQEEMQKLADWSEEDEKLLDLSVNNLTELKDRFGKEYGRVGDCIDWLKSLRPQLQWKPSNEQIEALKNTLNDAIWQYDFRGSSIKEEVTRKHVETIESLYNDLKKLREE